MFRFFTKIVYRYTFKEYTKKDNTCQMYFFCTVWFRFFNISPFLSFFLFSCATESVCYLFIYFLSCCLLFDAVFYMHVYWLHMPHCTICLIFLFILFHCYYYCFFLYFIRECLCIYCCWCSRYVFVDLSCLVCCGDFAFFFKLIFVGAYTFFYTSSDAIL